MQKPKFKHQEGDIIETAAGRFGKVVAANVIYNVSFGPDDWANIPESEIVTEIKAARIRKKKEAAPVE